MCVRTYEFQTAIKREEISSRQGDIDETTKPLLLYERHRRVQINSCRGQARQGAVGGKLNGLKFLTYGEEGHSSPVISLRHPGLYYWRAAMSRKKCIDQQRGRTQAVFHPMHITPASSHRMPIIRRSITEAQPPEHSLGSGLDHERRLPLGMPRRACELGVSKLRRWAQSPRADVAVRG